MYGNPEEVAVRLIRVLGIKAALEAAQAEVELRTDAGLDDVPFWAIVCAEITRSER